MELGKSSSVKLSKKRTDVIKWLINLLWAIGMTWKWFFNAPQLVINLTFILLSIWFVWETYDIFFKHRIKSKNKPGYIDKYNNPVKIDIWKETQKDNSQAERLYGKKKAEINKKYERKNKIKNRLTNNST